MPHENLFFVEKHANDSLHKPQRPGTSHTDREIQAAAVLLGRRSVHVEERHVKRLERRRAEALTIARVRSEGEAVGGTSCVVLGAGSSSLGVDRPSVRGSDDEDADVRGRGERDDDLKETNDGGGGGPDECNGLTGFGKQRRKRAKRPDGAWNAAVIRIDTAALSGERLDDGGGGSGVRASGPAGARRLVAEDRWKTERRIAGGGTAGPAALASARRAARDVERGERHEGDEDDLVPVLVAPEELEFDEDGWSRAPESSASASASVLSASRTTAMGAAEEALREAAAAAAADRAAAAAERAARERREAGRRERLRAALAGEATHGAEDGERKTKKKKKDKGASRPALVSFREDD